MKIFFDAGVLDSMGTVELIVEIENRWAQLLGMVITFHVVMVSFLIFSGFLNDLWF